MEAPKRVVLDTTIIVRHLRGSKAETELIERLQEASNLATTIVNAFEIYYGAHKSREAAKNVSAAKGFLGGLDEVLSLDENCAERAGKIMAELESKGTGLDPRDVLIGAIASANGYPVLTLNSKRFERIADLQVIDPKELRFT
jgi:tRNA(fMet)-specific endonuclease VapC